MYTVHRKMYVDLLEFSMHQIVILLKGKLSDKNEIDMLRELTFLLRSPQTASKTTLNHEQFHSKVTFVMYCFQTLVILLIDLYRDRPTAGVR